MIVNLEEAKRFIEANQLSWYERSGEHHLQWMGRDLFIVTEEGYENVLGGSQFDVLHQISGKEVTPHLNLGISKVPVLVDMQEKERQIWNVCDLREGSPEFDVHYITDGEYQIETADAIFIRVDKQQRQQEHSEYHGVYWYEYVLEDESNIYTNVKDYEPMNTYKEIVNYLENVDPIFIA